MRLARLLALILCLISTAALASNGNGNPSGGQSRVFSFNTSPLLTQLPGTVIQMANANGVGTRLEVDSFASGGHITFARIDGTAAAPTAVQSTDVLGGPNAWGYNGTGLVGPTASIDFVASQNWTTGANGTQINFWTTLNSTTTPSLAFTIGNDGGLFSATVTGGDKGPGTGNFNALFVGGVAVGTNSSAALSALTSATTGNSIDNGASVQSWAWGALSTQTAFSLSAPNATTGTVLKITSTGTGNALSINGNASFNPPIPATSGGTGYQLAAFAQQLALTASATGGGSDTNVCWVGDSTVFGVGSTGSTSVGQNFPLNSMPSQFAQILTQSYGINADIDSFWGDAENSPNYGNSDARITMGSSWSQDTTIVSLGLGTFKATTTTNSLDFTPVDSVDTFTVYYTIISTAGVMSAQVGSGSVVTQDTSTGTNNSIGHFTVTGTLGANTVHLKYVNGTQVNVVGVKAYNSTISSVHNFNMGAPASTSTNWNVGTLAYNPANAAAYQVIGCNLFVVLLGINDAFTGTGVTTFTNNMQALITAFSSVAPVVLLTPVPSTNITASTQAQYYNAIRGLWVSNNLTHVDLNKRWVSATYAIARALYGDNIAHPNRAGYIDNANAVISVVIPVNYSKASLGGALSSPLTLTLTSVSSENGILLNLSNQNTGGTQQIFFNGNPNPYAVGVGNSGQGGALANNFYVYNQTSGHADILINSSGNTGIGSDCNANNTLVVCGNFGINGYGYQFQGSAAANTNAYFETNNGALASTTNLNPGLLVFGGQNASNYWGLDLGYNSTTTRFRTRVAGNTGGDVALSHTTSGTNPSGQSSFTDDLVVRGDTGFVGIGTVSPSTLLTLSQTTTSGPVATFTNSAGTCTHTPGSSSETVSCSSDIRLKKNIEDAPDVLPWLQTFRIRQYDLIATGQHIYDGVVAQEVAEKHHRMVHEGPNGYLTVDAPDNWVLIKAFQEQQAEITQLQAFDKDPCSQFGWFGRWIMGCHSDAQIH